MLVPRHIPDTDDLPRGPIIPIAISATTGTLATSTALDSDSAEGYTTAEQSHLTDEHNPPFLTSTNTLTDPFTYQSMTDPTTARPLTSTQGFDPRLRYHRAMHPHYPPPPYSLPPPNPPSLPLPARNDAARPTSDYPIFPSHSMTSLPVLPGTTHFWRYSGEFRTPTYADTL